MRPQSAEDHGSPPRYFEGENGREAARAGGDSAPYGVPRRKLAPSRLAVQGAS